MDKYDVILDGWPVSTFAIDGASRGTLEKIKRAIDSNECTWKKASEDEIQTHLDKLKLAPKRHRKVRSDKGKRRRRQVSNEEVDEDESTNTPPPSRPFAKRRADTRSFAE